MEQNQIRQPEVIEAAGGLLTRENQFSLEILLIHRPKYDDWTLPKGKREDGETWQETALREVREETGYKTRLENFAGCTAYLVKDTPKIVLFWRMSPIGFPNFTPGDEVDQTHWFTLRDALRRISYQNEKEIIRKSLIQQDRDPLPINE